MKTTRKIFFAGAVLAALSVPLTAAAAVNVDVNIGLPGFSTVVTQPAYYYPPVAYYSPAPRGFVHHRDWDRHEFRHDFRRDYRHEERRHW